MMDIVLAVCIVGIVWAGIAAAMMRARSESAKTSEDLHEPHKHAGAPGARACPTRGPSYEPPVTRDDLQRIRAAAEAACASNIRNDHKARNPYPMGSRRYVAWQTYYLEAEATAEWWRARFVRDGDR